MKSIESIDKTAKSIGTFDSINYGVYSPSGSVTGTCGSSATTSLPSGGGCGVLITDDTKSPQCNRCQSDQWKCIECLNITADVYDKLMSDPACSLKWFCDGCDSVVSCLDVNSITSAVTNSVSNAMDRFADLLRDIEQNLVRSKNRHDGTEAWSEARSRRS